MRSCGSSAVLVTGICASPATFGLFPIAATSHSSLDSPTRLPEFANSQHISCNSLPLALVPQTNRDQSRQRFPRVIVNSAPLRARALRGCVGRSAQMLSLSSVLGRGKVNIREISGKVNGKISVVNAFRDVSVISNTPVQSPPLKDGTLH
jgi:hypothetical protein